MDIDDFIEKHERAIYRYCYSICGRRELAEELAQETFVRLLANYALLSSQPESQQLAWTFTTARHVAIDAVRSKKREQQYIEHDMNQEPHTTAIAETNVEDLLAKLSTTTREVIEMRFVLGMNSREIAEQTNVPEGTVRRRIQRGLAKIKQNLE